MNFLTKKNRGFTLIELLVVIAIIGILSSIILASLNSARQKARDARRIGDIKQIQLALEMYYDSNTGYPTTTAGLLALVPNYIPVQPKDPQTNAYYTYVSSSTDYVLEATLERNNTVLRNDIDGMVSGVNCGATPEVAGAYYYCVKP